MKSLDKVLPQNLDCEQSILGAVLVDNDSLIQALDLLGPEDFYRDSHSKIYSAFIELTNAGKAVDVMTACEFLRERGELERVGGQSYIMELATMVPTAANIKYHANIVGQKAIQRRVIQWARNIQNEAFDGPGEMPRWFGRMEQQVLTLAEKIKEKKSPFTSHIVEEVIQDWKDIKDGIRKPIRTSTTYIDHLPGFYAGHLWIVAGYTSHCKSSFIDQLMVDAKRNDAEIMLFSTEDSRKEKTQRLLANIADVPRIKLITGETGHYTEELDEAIRIVSDWDIAIYDDVMTVEEIRLKAKKHKLRHGKLDIVFVDYVQNLVGDGDIYSNMSHAARSLFRMAKELEVTVIAASQIPDEAAMKKTDVLRLKGAGELAASADIVLWLTLGKHGGKSMADRDLRCAIRKNRPFGKTGKISLEMSERWTRVRRKDGSDEWEY